MASRNNSCMQTTYGPFEPSVLLDDKGNQSIMRSLTLFEEVRASSNGSFTIEHDLGQPLVVTEINGKRLELPVFEAAELDCQRLVGNQTTNVVPLRIDGKPFTGVNHGSNHLAPVMVDALVSVMMIANYNISLLPQTLLNALE
jgi:hypothetical protein